MKLIHCFFVIIYLKIIHAKLCIDVQAEDNGEVTINYSGVNTNLVTQQQIEKFRVNTKEFRTGLQKHLGAKPQNVYLKSPTPWGDLYKKYKWEQVTRVLVVKSARMKSIAKKPVVVMSHDFNNYSNKTIKVNTGFSQSVENTFSTSWSKSSEVMLSQSFEYDVNLIFTKVTGTTSFSYTSAWGKTDEKTESVTIGSTTAMETELQPGQAATAMLTANRGYLEMEVVYKAYLRGNVAVNFRKKYNGHHFYGPHIADVMEDGGLSNEFEIVETVKIGVYMDSSLKVYDKATGLPI